MNRREFTTTLAALMVTVATPIWAQTDDAAALPEVPDMMLGNPDATVVLTEYASYTCPHCATFHASVFPELKRDYIDTNKIKFIFREVYFDRYGLWASMVARCGGDMRYFGIQDLIFTGMEKWAASDDPAVVVENLRGLGRAAGLENTALDACMNDGEMAQAMVNKYQADTQADEITSTPSFVLNGKKFGNMSYAELKALIDAELEK